MFTDRDTDKVYRVGDTYSGSAVRISELADKGHVEKVDPKSSAKKPKK